MALAGIRNAKALAWNSGSLEGEAQNSKGGGGWGQGHKDRGGWGRGTQKREGDRKRDTDRGTRAGA